MKEELKITPYAKETLEFQTGIEAGYIADIFVTYKSETLDKYFKILSPVLDLRNSSLYLGTYKCTQCRRSFLLLAKVTQINYRPDFTVTILRDSMLAQEREDRNIHRIYYRYYMCVLSGFEFRICEIREIYDIVYIAAAVLFVRVCFIISILLITFIADILICT